MSESVDEPVETGQSYLFVYGTLMRAIGHPMHSQLSAHGEYAGQAMFNGRLYLVEDYPGVVVSTEPEDQVSGELYRLRNADVALKILDDYEGCGRNASQPTLYERKLLRVQREDGAFVAAWVYLYNRPVGGLTRIASGGFKARSTTAI